MTSFLQKTIKARQMAIRAFDPCETMADENHLAGRHYETVKTIQLVRQATCKNCKYAIERQQRSATARPELPLKCTQQNAKRFGRTHGHGFWVAADFGCYAFEPKADK